MQAGKGLCQVSLTAPAPVVKTTPALQGPTRLRQDYRWHRGPPKMRSWEAEKAYSEGSLLCLILPSQES